MVLKTEVIAKKYAQALLNLYADRMDQECFQSLLDLEKFFKANRKLSIYLSLPALSDEVKQKALNKMFETFAICDVIKKLIHTLLLHRRIEMLDKVLHHLINQYRMRSNQVLVSVKTSHPLMQPERETVIAFFEHATGASVAAEFMVDKTLISGMRIKGDNFMWERSLAKQLRDVKLSFIQRVRSW